MDNDRRSMLKSTAAKRSHVTFGYLRGCVSLGIVKRYRNTTLTSAARFIDSCLLGKDNPTR